MINHLDVLMINRMSVIIKQAQKIQIKINVNVIMDLISMHDLCSLINYIRKIILVNVTIIISQKMENVFRIVKMVLIKNNILIANVPILGIQ